jgi:hypothetical protein
MRLGAVPVSAKIGHDHPKAATRDFGCVAEADPVRRGI